MMSVLKIFTPILARRLAERRTCVRSRPEEDYLVPLAILVLGAFRRGG